MAKQYDKAQLAAQARNYTTDAILFLKSIMYGDPSFVDKAGHTREVGEVAPIAVRMKAAELLCNRGHGTPKETVELTGGEDEDGTSKAIKVAVVHIRRAVEHDEAD